MEEHPDQTTRPQRTKRGQKRQPRRAQQALKAYNRLSDPGRVGNCPHNNKIQYPGKQSAAKAAKTLRKEKGPKTEAYLCVYCNLWHIGHWRLPQFRKPKEEPKKGKVVESNHA